MAHSPLPWHVGHLADDAHSCNCDCIGNEHGVGGIARILVNNGLKIADGGNEAPPLEEAKDNMLYIVKSVNAYPELMKALNIFLGHDERFQVAVGGNPIAVDAMLSEFRNLLKSIGEL